ncbi:tetratricopeptide repeat protein [Tuwongella immobilis]|uniref:Tetratricopeptide repeat protein n=1 Tax=Tuwongella immobilis TaxID=692036 RepID=A0A6C2YUF2_9BACT|nr:tetratricopeptide repeat protein [Tuwongella immobilis]VIP04545.1 tpr domain protein : TPR domain protein OS=Acaryochloris marina (strain MBIC 11017) GN=AM1_2739 PE=4 SV=1: TPR_11 [Tuwongella immobilis]VTS06451.1 tpr domain protein : TPR domain protein OS=Acaryochloris marina (strain MBIC 11017) GN=AM1_2739 PE=4 SV=1: TPR_11 [Tuwongella immobilis]
MELASTDLATLRDLYNRGLYLQARRYAEAFGPLRDWSNPPARLMAGRLAIQLGASRLGRRLHLLAYRLSPNYPEAIYYYARYRLDRMGPLHAYTFMRQHSDWSDAGPEMRADWYGLHAYVAARLRDFDRAEIWLQRAEAENAGRAWLLIERSAVYELAERTEEALEAARETLKLVPYFRAGLQASAHLLHLLNRDAEALDLLQEGSDAIESSIVTAQLAAFQLDQRRYTDVRKSLARYRELAPMLESEGAKWLHAREVDVAYFLGEWGNAQTAAKQIDEPYYRELIERLQPLADQQLPLDSPIDGHPRRTEIKLAPEPLPSGQHPTASYHLKTLSRFWKPECPDPNLPESTPFEGVPESAERRWAESNGFIVREGKLSPEGAFAVLERGIPFFLTTVESGYPVPQLVVGCDRVRHSLLFADAAPKPPIEAPLRTLLERYIATGPRMLVMVPSEQAQLLDGITLDDEAEANRLHALQSALKQSNRDGAVAELDALRAANPTHRITLQAACVLARYDSHPVKIADAILTLSQAYPNEATYQLSHLAALRELGRREERIELLQSLADRNDVEPLLLQHYAQSISMDIRQQSTAKRALMRAIRKRGYAAGAYYLLARLMWEQRRFGEATELYRFAACLEDRDEQFAEGYFRAARAAERTPEAMRFLQNRFHRMKTKHLAPTRSLFFALAEQDEITAAFDILQQALRARPNDGETLLFAAEMKSNFDDLPSGRKLLEQARPHSPALVWHRAAARQCALEVNLGQAIAHWLAILAEEPLNVDAHTSLVRVKMEYEGRPAAIEYLRNLVKRYPHSYGVRQLLLDWLRGEPGTENEGIVQKLIDECPHDSWAHRELALYLAAQKRYEEALARMEKARELEPTSPLYFFSMGRILTQADRLNDAREIYREAIRRSVDHEMAVSELLQLARSQDEREQELQFIARELARQSHQGESLMTFFEKAYGTLETEELHSILNDLLDSHAHLWQVWSMMVRVLAMMERFEEASELVREAIERFPLVPRLWADQAAVRRSQEDPDGEIDSLRGALRINPSWSEAARELSELLEQQKQTEDAQLVLEQAIARAPFDPNNHGYLAELLWNNNDSETALERIARAVRLDPAYEWAWRTFMQWSDRLEVPEKQLELAREVTRLRPGDVNSWLSLARMLSEPSQFDESLHALDRAIALNPRLIEAYDLKAERLTEMGRFEEAKSAAQPDVFPAEDLPMVLRGRVAWVEAKRGNFSAAIPRMQALVAVEPNYYWGWQQLAEWQNETGRHAAYLEAASELVRLRPESPMALAMRGEARMQTGDRENGKADLRQAQQIAPGYPFPGMLLFDAYFADGDTSGARTTLAILQEHMGGPLVLARHIQLLAKEGDRDSALESLRDLCHQVADTAWPIQTAVNTLRAAGWSDDVEPILKQAVDGEEPFHPWVALLWVEGPAGSAAEIDVRLTVLQRAVAEHPRFLQGYDLLAETLARVARYDEALEACKPPAFGDPPPISLRGRAAWIEAQRGNRAEAIKQMRSLVQADSEYFWGWQQLARWYDANDSYKEYLEVAEQLVRIAPNEAISYGHRGEAKRGLNDKAGAKADFAKAFEIDPQYAFAGLRLLEEQLAENQLDDAEKTLGTLQQHADTAFAALATVQVATKRGDIPVAIDALRDLATSRDSSYMLLGKAIDTLQAAKADKAIDDMLGTLIDQGNVRPFVARFWAERRMPNDIPTLLARLPKLLEEGDAGEEVVSVLLSWFDGPEKAGELALLLQNHSESLQRNLDAWARVGDALVSTGNYTLAISWLSDWQKRTGVESWMLSPLVFSLRQAGRWEESQNTAIAALELPTELAYHDHGVWAAIEEALAGKPMPAKEHLERVELSRLSDEMRLLAEMAKLLIAVQLSPPTERRRILKLARPGLKEAIALISLKEDPSLVPTYRRFVARLGSDLGLFHGLLWRIRQAIAPDLKG